ncbi:MAG: DUF86 domain-containing protein [Polyangiaceae bacterium]|nr:DUF86 domain-containing protein [Polyangiaceae bacterium]
MNLRADVVRERLALVRRNVAELERLAALGRPAFASNLREQWAAAYGLQTAVQALLDAGAHVLSGHFKDAPRDYGEIIPQLAARGVISAELAARMAGASGFRNILVHEYGAVDYALVFDKLADLGDLEALGGAIESWLTGAAAR